MAVAYVNAGAGASGAANCTPALPAGIATGDVLIAVVEGANQAPAIGAQNGGAWATVAAHTGTGAAGGTTATGITLYWDRYNGTQTAPNFTDGGGDHVGARIYAFSGVKSTGNPWNAVQTSIDATSDTSLSATGLTTTVDNCLVVIAATLMDDAQDFGATWTNTDLTSITVRDASFGHAAGNDGRLILVTGLDAVAGTVGATTNTTTANSVKAMVVMALEPAGSSAADAGVGTINVSGVAASPASDMVTLTGGVGTINVSGVAAAAVDSGMVTVTGGVGTINVSGVPSAAVAGVTLEQAAFRGRNDDGSETTATWKAAENANWNQPVETVFRLRLVVDETGGVNSPQIFGVLQRRLNGGSWSDVTGTSTVAQSAASAFVSDLTVCTRQLTAGTGTFHTGEFDSNNGIAHLGGANPYPAGDYVESEWCLKLLTADVVNGDTVEFRVIRNSGVPLEVYSHIPMVTVGVAGSTADAGVGTINVSGVAASPASGMVDVTAGVGSINLTGVTGSPASGMATVTATPGSITVAGRAASTAVSGMVNVTAVPGTINITGLAAIVPLDVVAGVGTIHLSGVAAIVPLDVAAGTGEVYIVGRAGTPLLVFRVVGPSTRQRRIPVA